MKEKIKTIGLIVLAIVCAITMFMYSNLKSDYSINEHKYQSMNDSLCTELSIETNKYDSLSSYTQLMITTQKASYDSLNELYKTKIDTHKEKVVIKYKDSTVIRYVEDSHVEQEHKVEYVEKEVVKEVVQYVHDTVAVTKIDTVYQEAKTEVVHSESETQKEVVDNTETFNIYVDGGVRGNLDYDIIPEVGAGVIIKEKFYGEIDANYDKGKINPSAKLGIRLKVF